MIFFLHIPLFISVLLLACLVMSSSSSNLNTFYSVTPYEEGAKSHNRVCVRGAVGMLCDCVAPGVSLEKKTRACQWTATQTLEQAGLLEGALQLPTLQVSHFFLAVLFLGVSLYHQCKTFVATTQRCQMLREQSHHKKL